MCHDWTVFNYSCYKFFDRPTRLDSAENTCLNHSGHVTSINSIKENEFLTRLTGQDVWLGLESDSMNKASEGIRWLDGSPVTYVNWNGINHADEFGVLQGGGTQSGGWEYVLNNASQSGGREYVLNNAPQSGGWEYVSKNASFPYVCKRGTRGREQSINSCSV